MTSDPLKLAADAAELLDRLGIVAYSKRSEGRVTLEGSAVAEGRRVAFSLELDDEIASAEALCALCVAKVKEAVGGKV